MCHGLAIADPEAFVRQADGASFRGLEFLRSRLGSRFVAGVVLYTGPEPLPFGDRVWALPYATIWS